MNLTTSLKKYVYNYIHCGKEIPLDRNNESAVMTD